MSFQLLISTMYQSDYSLLDKMNVQSDALMINQCNDFRVEGIKYHDNVVQIYSLPERGIGLSRNLALLYATADICLFADDDVQYVDNYKDIILSELQKHPQKDIILFNIESNNPLRPETLDLHAHNIYFFNCLRYGAFRIAFRTCAIRKARLSFSHQFGGGGIYGSGEDSLFLVDCLRKGLRIFASAKLIGTVNHDISTWFQGYNEKFFRDKGALFAAISRPLSKLLCLQFCIRHKEMLEDKSFREVYNLMLLGIKEYGRIR